MINTDLWVERYESRTWWVVSLGNELIIVVSGHDIKLPSDFLSLSESYRGKMRQNIYHDFRS